MKVLLKKSIGGLGKKNDVVDVKPGYANNYLVPKGFAIYADDSVIASANKIREAELKKLAEKEAGAKDALGKLESDFGGKIEMICKTNKKGKLYKQISESDISEMIEQLTSFHIPEEFIQITDSIKNIGEHKLTITVASQSAEITAVVKSEEQIEAENKEKEAKKSDSNDSSETMEDDKTA